MQVSQIARLFRQYVDEPNKTFLTDDDVRLYLQIGYDQFREIASACDPKSFAVIVANLPLQSQTQVDLTASPIVAGGTNSILGSTAWTSGRGMIRLIDVVQTSVLGDLSTMTQILRAAGSFNDLYVPDLLAAESYFLNGTSLFFSDPLQGFFTLIGIKQQDPALWSNLASTNVPDDMVLYHDLIALLAYRNYAVRDGALAPAAEAQLAKRTQEFMEYVSFGRQQRGNNKVLVEDHDVYYY